jgi:hypothetical protein
MTQSERPSSIRLWLARYKPDRVRCTLSNGDLRELPKPTTARGQWAQLEHAITLLRPSYLEAFQGTTCVASRALEGEDDVDDVPAPAPATDPMAAMAAQLPTIVGLIVEAADASALRHQESYRMSFDSLLQLVKILSDRLGGLERAWHKMNLDRAAEMAGVAAGGDGNDAMAASILGNIIQRGNGAPPPTNGASASPPVADD